MRKLICLILALAFLPSMIAFADARTGSSNYLYTPHDEIIAAPPAYTLARSITARDMPEIDALDGLVDAFRDDSGVYILCSKRLIIMDHDLKVKSVLTAYMDGDKEVKLDGCTGVTVTKDGDIYITQSEKGQILHFNPDYTLNRVMGKPEIVGYENVNYRPTKMVVDAAGRLYVISKNMYEGILELNADGTFTRFFGVNEVTFTPWQLFWRTFATKEQRARQALWLPSDFTNLCIDQDGFLFATLLSTDEKTIKRLNAKGENIIKVSEEKPYPQGDLWTNETGFGIPTGKSQFIAVDVNDFGAYVCLDSTRSRIFGYNEDHSLLFVFGGPGDREGYFRNPVDVIFVGEDILVLDSLAQSIEVFSPTKYGSALMNAVKYQYLYDYEVASKYWEEALSYNHNLTLAYSGVGRMLLRSGEYEEAMEFLEMGDDRKYYDKAYEKVRTATLREYFVPGMLVILGLIAVKVTVSSVKRARKKRKGAA